MNNDQEASELWISFRQGDPKALNLLIELFYKVLFDYGARFTNDYALVEDAIQDLFLDLWRRHSFLSDTASVRFYLLKSLRRKIHVLHKTAMPKEHQFFECEENLDILAEYPVESEIISRETNEHLQKKLKAAVKQLTKRQQEAVYLKFYQELEYHQVSELMSISEQSAYNLIHSAIKSLREVM